MKRLQIMVTQQCNSNCSYCMVNHINLDLDKDLINKINKIADQYETDTILLFGGEPLLKEDIIYQIKDQIENKAIILPTNGKLLKDKHIMDFKNILISSNGTYETCKLTGQTYIPEILDIENKDRCTIGMRITPESVFNMKKDFDYFYNAGFIKYNIVPIIEMDWQEEHYNSYKDGVEYIIKKIPRDNIWTWQHGGICVPYQGTVCLDQKGEIWSCARYCSDNIKIPKIPERYFKQCLNCKLLPWCFHSCHYLNQIKTGSAVKPYIGICNFAKIYKDIFDKG